MKMFRTLFLAHRYLGIAVGLMMAAWCVSGIVMMYVPYPEPTRHDQLAGLKELDFERCCQLPPAPELEGWVMERASIEMLAGRPVLRTPIGYQGDLVLDLEMGQFIDGVNSDEATIIASDWIAARGLDEGIASTGTVELDQWTVYGSYNPHRPLHHFRLDGSAGREVYVSSTTGEVVQFTTRSQRFWNWVGSITHWLYPVVLRRNGVLWSNVVIYLSLAGIFLTVIGLYIGIRQAGRGRGGALSPYRGWSKWHHWSGLFFGVLVLTWVASGFLSMNPWGALSGNTARIEAQGLHGAGVTWDEVSEVLEATNRLELPPGLVRLDLRSLGNRAWVTAYRGDGAAVRLGTRDLQPAPIEDEDWKAIPALLAGDAPVRSAELIDSEDSYYYSHHDEKTLPVYRVILDDEERTRYYLDGVNGNLLAKIDTQRRWYRWLFSAFHRLDLPVLRQRPLWDFVMLVLMLGVTTGCITGAYMGFRRLTR